MAAVDVAGLTMRYGDVVAVRELSFSADAGQVTCVLGRNGAGKTSTIEALEGLRRPAGGRLSVLGLDPQRQQRELSRRIGVMLQEVGIQPSARVDELVRHAAALYPQALDPAELIEQVGLTGRTRRAYRQLSGGEQRRLALALALVGRPEVAFLDEPTAGVDPEGRRVIREIVADLRASGVAVLLSTHDLDEAERIADRVVIIDAGRLVAQGTVAELTSGGDVAPMLRFHAPSGLDVDALSARLGSPGVALTAEVRPGEYVIDANPTPALIATVAGWLAERNIAMADLSTDRHSLEDTFLRLTGRPVDDTDPVTGRIRSRTRSVGFNGRRSGSAPR
jgi:ABC-2 type transport system ATP-binding protein